MLVSFSVCANAILVFFKIIGLSLLFNDRPGENAPDGKGLRDQAGEIMACKWS
jgi:hypothetical protein